MSKIKIAVVGPESTGKSALCNALAHHYKTNWVPEMARIFLEHLNRKYTYDDLSDIAHLQLKKEDELFEKSKKVLICDTNLIVIHVWSNFKFGKTASWIINEIESRNYNLHLLTNVDLPWEFDDLREHPTKRIELFMHYQQALHEFKIPYYIVSGIAQERLKNALQIISENFPFLKE
jgi:NadR type nicotinamide-nucleotide adenylyltransferase